jgi:hypothetical protein
MNYKDSKAAINSNINQTARSFVAIGFYLKHIRDKEMFHEDGYQNIWALAQGEFGISKPQASKFMAINDKFSVDGNSPILLEQYKDFSSSKLQEMLYLTDEQLEQVTVGTTVAEIREIKNPDKTVSTSKQEPEPEKVVPAQVEPEPDEPYWKKNIIPMPQRNEYIEQLALYLLRCSFDWFVSDTFNRVLHVGESEKEIKKEFRNPSSTWYVKMLNGEVYHFNLFEDIIQVYSPTEHLGYIEWFYLCAAVQRKYNTVAFERSNQKPEVDGQPEAVNDTQEPENTVDEPDIPCDTCGYEVQGCCDYTNTEDDYCVLGSKWKQRDTDTVETVAADIIQTEPESSEGKWYRKFFFGAYDCEETPIHEGDHIKVNDRYYRIKWNQRESRFVAEEVNKSYLGADLVCWPMYRINECKVVGSIYPSDEKPVEAEKEAPEQVQPELPVLKNNDQRSEWLKNYQNWGIWYQDDNINARYYKYDFLEGSRIVVVEHMHKQYVSTGKYEDTWGHGQYHLIGGKDKYSSYVHEFFNPYPDNTSELVEHLKNVQRKK